MHGDVTSLRCSGYIEKRAEETAQLLLRGKVRMLTDFQSFQRPVLKVIGGPVAYMHCFLLMFHL